MILIHALVDALVDAGRDENFVLVLRAEDIEIADEPRRIVMYDDDERAA